MWGPLPFSSHRNAQTQQDKILNYINKNKHKCIDQTVTEYEPAVCKFALILIIILAAYNH